jgi:hypothetical protein
MKITALEIPDDPRELPHWLEQQMVGLDLAALVAELEAVHGRAAPQPRDEGGGLDALLGAHLATVGERGLAALPPEILRRLLLQPRLLLDLQEHVLVSGGKHWQHLAATSEDLRRPFERGRARLDAILGAPAPAAAMRAPLRLRWVIGAAAAALVLAAALWVYWPGRQPAGAGAAWGWSAPGVLRDEGPPSAYLNRLADAAEEWFQQRPEDAAKLDERIAELRRGCDRLIAAEHRPLAVADREWLVTRCRAWAGKLDAQREALKAGAAVEQVRGQTDRTVRQLIDALRQRAKAV